MNEDKILSEEQGAIVNLVRREEVFSTGNAGTNRSIMLLAIINSLKNKFGKDAVAVTASTSIAANHVGG